MRFVWTLLLAAIVPLAVLAPVGGQENTVHFTPTVGYPTFAVREPVLHLKPGTTLVSKTNFGDYYTEEGGDFPGEVGPFYIDGATTEDTLVVRVIKVQPNHDIAASALFSNFISGLATDSRLRLLNDPIPDRRYVWRLDREKMTGTTQLPDSKMKEIEIVGGNLDAPEVRAGTTVYLPIFHDGAYFYFGDGHARQGQGEVGGTGLETSMDVVLEIDLIKGKKIDWPRLEDDEYIMVAGSARPLIDAFRLAHVELIEWMEEEYGFGRWDAYQLLGELAESTVANIVDPAFTVVAKFPKKYLPK
jgi:acetamidase/formamidase